MPSLGACSREGPAPRRGPGEARCPPQRAQGEARITQIMNLLLLAPDIQAEVLDLRFPPGREPVTERHLRQILASPVWREQRETWADVRPTR